MNIKKNDITFVFSLLFTINSLFATVPAVEFFDQEDIKRSSRLLLDTQSNQYEPNVTKIIEPSTNNIIGQIIPGEKDKIDIVLRGTNDLQELSSFLSFQPSSIDSLGFKNKESKGHTGLSKIAKDIKDQIIHAISSFQNDKKLEPENMKIIAHGSSRGTGITPFIATSLKEIYTKTPIYVLNYAPLPFLNSTALDEYDTIIDPQSHLNFICNQDGVLNFVNGMNNTTHSNFAFPGTKIFFDASQHEEFKNRIGNYSFLSGGPLAEMGLNFFGITAEGWEGHTPLTYLHSADPFNLYKISALNESSLINLTGPMQALTFNERSNFQSQNNNS